jgi:hypothetical protein
MSSEIKTSAIQLEVKVRLVIEHRSARTKSCSIVISPVADEQIKRKINYKALLIQSFRTFSFHSDSGKYKVPFLN